MASQKVPSDHCLASLRDDWPRRDVRSGSKWRRDISMRPEQRRRWAILRLGAHGNAFASSTLINQRASKGTSMTHRDPYDDPQPQLQTRPQMRRPANDDGLGMGTLAAMALAAILIIGGLMYAFMGDRSVTSATAPRPNQSAPSTTGQGNS